MMANDGILQFKHVIIVLNTTNFLKKKKQTNLKTQITLRKCGSDHRVHHDANLIELLLREGSVFAERREQARDTTKNIAVNNFKNIILIKCH